jgi:hypothetical protein
MYQGTYGICPIALPRLSTNRPTVENRSGQIRAKHRVAGVPLCRYWHIVCGNPGLQSPSWQRTTNSAIVGHRALDMSDLKQENFLVGLLRASGQLCIASALGLIFLLGRTVF